MKPSVLIFLCLLGVLALVEFSSAQNGQRLCDSPLCMSDCFEQGLHGQCDPDDVCRCYNCIYRACRRLCIKQNRVGQCDETNCLCL